MKNKITVKDIAARLGVSSSTVSFVLNGVDKGISADTKNRVLAAAAAMHYDKLPRSNVTGWTRVAFLSGRVEYFNFYTSFFAGVYNYLHCKAAADKIELTLHEFNVIDAEEAYLQLQKLLGQKIDVFICSNKNCAKYLLQHGLKVILAQAGMLRECVSIFCDDYTAGSVAGEYALSMGHTTAGTIFPRAAASNPRYNGFTNAFTEGGGNLPPEFRILVDFEHNLMIEQTDKALRGKNLPTMFYCYADNLMFPVIRALHRQRKSIPGDISLIGTDNLYWGRYAQPAFTTIDLNEEMFASRLIEAVRHLINNGAPYQLAVPVHLIERETVKKI
jgi:DNA-binding LacI/PurR family transcriptional regulator